MENQYRNMMDEVRASEGLRQEIMNISGQERTQKTRSAPMRALTVAACICALLIIGAVAVEVARSGFVKIYRWTGESGNVFFFGNYEDVGKIPVEELSPELRALADLYRDEAFHQKFLSFDTWEEAEDFLGRNIMDNPLLAGGGYLPNGVTYGEEHIEGNCVVGIITDYGVIRYVTVDARYSLEPEGSWASPWVTVEASIYVEQNFEGTPLESAMSTEEPTPQERASYTENYVEVKEQENYRTANGFKAAIFDFDFDIIDEDGNTYNSGSYEAFFFQPGIRISVRRHYAKEDKEMTLAELKQILDNFQ